jgi:pimeloyl-ACP methyl ester carboxylesterase
MPVISLGDWPKVAERFADYWLGSGSRDSMPDKRRRAFVDSLPPNFHEWDAIMEEEAIVDDWKRLTARTLLVSDAATRRPIREIVEIFAKACPHWTFRSVTGCGHMAPLTHPELINPIVREFLDSGTIGRRNEMATASDQMLGAR